jgi:hypothetical protein
MTLRLRVQKLDRPELVAYDRVLKHYGAACYLQKIEEREDYWKVPVGAYFQSKIVDEKTEKEQILTFNLQDVGEIMIRKSTMRVLSATPLSSLSKNILRKRAEIRQAVERDLIKLFGKPELNFQFCKIKYGLTGLQPIYRTLSRLLLGDYPSYEQLLESGQHYLEQVDLLIKIGYAEYTENQPVRLVATNKTEELYSREKSIEKTIDAVLGLILSEFYYELQKEMRIAQFVPYVRASTAYYGDAIQFGKLISISETRLRDNVKEYYKGTPLPARVRYAYPTMIRELVDAQILRYAGNYITGREDVFEELVSIRTELPMREEPFSLE